LNLEQDTQSRSYAGGARATLTATQGAVLVTVRGPCYNC